MAWMIAAVIEPEFAELQSSYLLKCILQVTAQNDIRQCDRIAHKVCAELQLFFKTCKALEQSLRLAINLLHDTTSLV